MTTPVIALLDNDPAFLTLMHDLLTDEGYRTVRWCVCGAIDPRMILRRIPPDLVIVDLGLGGERHGGWEMIQRLWSDGEANDIPAILLTGAAARPPPTLAALRAMRCRTVCRPFAHGDLRDVRDLAALLSAIEDELDLPSLHPEHDPRLPPRRAPSIADAAGRERRDDSAHCPPRQ